MGFLIRPAQVADAAAVARVNIASWRESYAHFLSPGFLGALDEQEYTERYTRGFERSTDRFIVLDVAGQVRGYAHWGAADPPDQPRNLQLYMIYQLASEHGSGSGQALLDASIGDRPGIVWVAEQNPRAIAFYRRNGFEPDGARAVEERWENLVEIRMVR